jgi:integrase
MLRTVYNKAREWGVYKGDNPVSKVRFYRESPEVRPLSDEDVAALMDAARTIAADPWSDVQRLLPDLLALAFNTGLRRGELVAVRWRDIHGEELRVLGKGNKRRTIPLNAAALGVIERQPKTGEYVFDICNRHQPDLFRRTVLRLRKLSRVADFHLHMTRHRFATDLIRAGVDIVTTSALLGHSAAMTTLLYAHPSAESKKRAVLALLSPDHTSTRD